MKDKTKVYIDLSKCTHNEIMELFSLTRGNYQVVGSFTILHMLDSEWVTDTKAVGKTELTYPDFIKLFEGGEGERTELLPDVAYWRNRCLLVEKAMEGISMHPTREQVKAHKDYNNFLEVFGKKD